MRFPLRLDLLLGHSVDHTKSVCDALICLPPAGSAPASCEFPFCLPASCLLLLRSAALCAACLPAVVPPLAELPRCRGSEGTSSVPRRYLRHGLLPAANVTQRVLYPRYPVSSYRARCEVAVGAPGPHNLSDELGRALRGGLLHFLRLCLIANNTN